MDDTASADARAVRYLPLARALARTLAGGRGDEAESDACLALLLASRDFREPSPIRFATFARFRIVKALAGSPPPFRTLGDCRAILDHSPGSDPAAAAEREDLARAILARLPAGLRPALRLTALLGLNREEAGLRLGLSPSEVSRRIRIARTLLGAPPCFIRRPKPKKSSQPIHHSASGSHAARPGPGVSTR